ncbi:MAG: DUF4097 family beta strand repeat protein, partial [Deinococcus sp.]|nr:DUF4097 family beta strand repeat protein [Deinococcus sp.]
MIREGKITVEEGERLLRALASGEQRGFGAWGDVGRVAREQAARAAHHAKRAVRIDLSDLKEHLGGLGETIRSAFEGMGEGVSAGLEGGLTAARAVFEGVTGFRLGEDAERVLLVDGAFDCPQGSKVAVWEKSGADLRLVPSETSQGMVLEGDQDEVRVYRTKEGLVVSASEDLTLALPQGVSELQVRAIGGDVAVEYPVQGRLYVNSAGGNLKVRRVEGSFELILAGGNVAIHRALIQGASSVKSAGGDVLLAVDPSSSAELKVASVGGSIKASAQAAVEIEAKHAPGVEKARIRIGQGQNQVVIKAVGGNVAVQLAGEESQPASGEPRVG